MGSIWLISAALAAECEDLGQAEFRSLLLDAQSAMDRADPDLQATFVEEIEGRLPCLVYVPTPREWSEFLVAIAIRRFETGGDWQTPLRTALWINPRVERGVGQAHPMARFDPGPQPPTTTSVPPGVNLYVDGARATALPAATGMHLVQREESGWYSTLVLVDSEVPAAWLSAPIERPPHWELSSNLALRGGALSTAQRPEGGSPDDYVPAMDLLEPQVGVGLRGAARYGRLALTGTAQLGAASFTRTSGALVDGGLGLALGPAMLTFGGGVTTSAVVEGDPLVVHDLGLPYGRVAIDLQLGNFWLGANAGSGPAVRRSAGLVGVTIPVDNLDIWVAGTGSFQTGSFTRGDTVVLDTIVWQRQAALEAGVAWGAGD